MSALGSTGRITHADVDETQPTIRTCTHQNMYVLVCAKHMYHFVSSLWQTHGSRGYILHLKKIHPKSQRCLGA
jgi:hypothetical protein